MILIGADIVPTESNRGLFENGNVNELLGTELLKILDKADFKVLNLEAPLTDISSPIVKHGPNLKVPTSCVEGIKAMGIDLLTIANNHIMDQDVQGLRSTFEVLQKAGIRSVGAGNNLYQAQQPYYIYDEEYTYGIYACAEHEFSIATERCPGANPFDQLNSLDHITDMKNKCDYAIVLYHGGKEHYRYPSPNLQKTCRKIVEKGADLVVCQHSHCIGCKEEYKNGTIIYGQGNFLFDYSDDECWKTGLLISVTDLGKIDFIPVIKQDNVVRLATAVDAFEIMKEFKNRSEEIKKDGVIEEKYQEFAKDNLENYVLYLRGIKDSHIIRVLRRFPLGKNLIKRYVKRSVELRGVGIRNYIECEAHRELLLKGLENYN